MIIKDDTYLDFEDVLLEPQRTTLESRKDVVLERAFQFYHSPRQWTGIPIICSNLACIAGKEIAIKLAKNKMITCLHKYHSQADLMNIFHFNELSHVGIASKIDYIWPTVGYSKGEVEAVLAVGDELFEQFNLCIDVANAHIDKIVEFCSWAREQSPKSIIMAGNVTNPACAQELIIHGGVDIVKVGTGPGKFCETRKRTGVGYPQLSAIINNSSVAHGLKNGEKRLGLICGDGGCRTEGDVCKAFCGGADFVMLGGMFCGVEESCGFWSSTPFYNIKEKQEKKYLESYGMSSETAQKKFGTEKKYRVSEGIETEWIKNKGPVQNVVNNIKGGLRSCCTYIGATSLKDMNKCAVFIKRR